MIKAVSKFLLIGAALAMPAMPASAADWKPAGPITMMIAFQAGGGADSQARLLADGLSKRYGWKIVPQNVPGKGGAIMAQKLKKAAPDGLTIGVSVSEAFSYTAQVLRNPGYSVHDFDYLSTLTGSQMGIVAKASRGWKTLGDVFAAIKKGKQISFGAMSQKLADGAYLIGKDNNVKFNVVRVRGGRGGVNGVMADDLDIAWAAGVQAPLVRSGDLVNLASAEEEPLKMSPKAPLLSKYHVPFIFGAKFMVIAPHGIPAAADIALQKAIAAVASDPHSKLNAFLNKNFSGPELIQGAKLRAYIEKSYKQASALIKASSN